MARTRTTIKNDMTTMFMADPAVQEKYGFGPGLVFEDVFSQVSLENIFFDQISFSIFAHEQIVEANAEQSRPHNVPWYKAQAQNFHDGLALVWKDGQFQYDLTGVDDAEERRIIARVAVLESQDSELVIKIATNVAGVIQPVTPEQLVRFAAYMEQIKDAGNQLRIINDEPDDLRLGLTVYVDEQIIDLATGKLLNVEGNVKPVEDAINAYLANLEFNGGFVTKYMLDTIQSAQGVRLPVVTQLQWKFAGFDFADFENWKIPEAGYFKIDPANLNITYEKYDLAAD